MIEALTFLFATSGLIVFFFRKSEKKSTSLFICFVLIALGLIAKLGYERHSKLPNFYTILEVGRSSSALDIRQSYKKVSKKLHPDKNPSLKAEEEFQRVKHAYDVLMDDETRDLYNRFGENMLDFDPRKDELKLLSNIGFVYVQWFVVVYILTIPELTRASRTWITFVCIGMIVTEVMLSLTDTKLPDYIPFNLTEHELISLLHAIFPGIISSLLAIAAYFYIDIDRQCSILLTYIAAQQKAIDEMLIELGYLLENSQATGNTGSTTVDIAPEKSIDGIKMHINELHTRLRTSQAFALASMELLKNANNNIASKYYWVVFVLLYVVVYLAQ